MTGGDSVSLSALRGCFLVEKTETFVHVFGRGRQLGRGVPAEAGRPSPWLGWARGRQPTGLS
jgi:hypothetical protein